MTDSGENPLPENASEFPLMPKDDQKTLEWLAVLSAAHFDYRLSREEHRWIIHLPAAQAAAARREIAAYESDGRGRDRPLPLAPAEWQAPPQPTMAALWGVGLMVAFYAWCGPFQLDQGLFRATASDAQAIMAGQWWRPVTALTLHAGFVHLAGNALCLLVLGHAVCSLFGGGLGWLLMLGSGVAGNFAVAWMVSSGHVSLGASTASFGAIGILVAHQSIQTFRQRRDWRSIWGRVWLPLGSGLALLALLGTGPESDLAAHLLGFIAGLVLATPFSILGVRGFPGWSQRLLELACLLTVLSAWAAALRQLGAAPL